MRLYANQLIPHLKKSLGPVYLVAGDEPLMVDECCQAIRQAACAAGYGERRVATVETGFDWNDWYASTQNLSLFSEHRLLDLRLPNARPGDRGAQVLMHYADVLPPDTILLVSTGKLDKSTRNTKWVQALEGAGVLVQVYSIETAQMPAWIAGRMQAKGLQPGPGVADCLAYHFEGNMLAAVQEIDKLSLLHGQARIAVDDIEQDLSDNARFNVFGLIDVCLRGDRAGAMRMLHGLRAEGDDPVLILKVLAREVRALAAIAAGLAAGRPERQLFQAFQIWPKRQPLVKQALKRRPPTPWLDILQRAAHVDRVIKGRASGDSWQELQNLALSMSGVNNQCLMVKVE